MYVIETLKTKRSPGWLLVDEIGLVDRATADAILNEMSPEDLKVYAIRRRMVRDDA